MEQKNNYDEIDKGFLSISKMKKEEPVPKSVYDAIDETVKKIKNSKSKTNYIQYLRKIAVIVLCIGVLSTGVVFAKDIVHYISAFFTRSTEGINTAVENNYVQVNLEYVYDNDIGVTIDHIVLDDRNLDISFVYKYEGNEKINDLQIDDFKIVGDTGKILWEELKGIRDYITEGNSLSRTENSFKVSENVYKGSLLISSEQFSKFNAITVEINSFRVKVNDEYITKEGKWILETPIDTNILSRETIQYKVEENEYVEDSFVEMTETALSIELSFNVDIDMEYESVFDNVNLVNADGKEYTLNGGSCNTRKLCLKYDVGKFAENIDNLILKLRIFENKYLELKLYK